MNQSAKPVNWLDVITIYCAALLVGLTMVSFPASSTLLKDAKGLTSSQYGFIFIPQFLTAVIGAIGGGSFAKQLGLKKIFGITLLANALSQIFLFLTVQLVPNAYAFYSLITATAFFGFAFGVSAAPFNTYPVLLFPEKRETGLVALHTMLGVGLAAGPSLAGWFISMDLWYFFPSILIVISLLLLLFLPVCQLPGYEDSGLDEKTLATGGDKGIFKNPVLWFFLVIVVIYAFAEGTFSNWAVVFLNEEKGIPISSASIALSAFWAMLAIGRLLASILLLKISSKVLWFSLPVLMVTSFLLIPVVNSATMGIAVFGLAGLACSAFFPISVDLISKAFPSNEAMVSSLMIAALMSGVGIGSYLIGSLRAILNLNDLYQISAAYPLVVLILCIILSVKFLKHRANA